MATIEQNRGLWGEVYDWQEGGDEWSAPWGGPDMHWYGSILPRIQQFVPTSTLLEIAPGYGRWTYWLKNLCHKLIVVDLSETCIEHCRKRFASEKHIEYHVNDGTSLAMVADRSVDFVFSYDSLVHAGIDVLREYVLQLSGKLSAHGVAFLHHSNIGEYQDRYSDIATTEDNHGRAFSVTADNVREAVESAGLVCVSQELLNWGSPLLTDCITVFTRKGSKYERPNVLLRNNDFMKEALGIGKLSALYGLKSFKRTE